VYGGTFTINGGNISGNTSSTAGGGVYIGYGTFTMNSGTISGNTASGYGGGVSVSTYYTFTKTGGTITGYNSDPVNGNMVKTSGIVQNNRGHAVYATPSFDATYRIKRKETTAGPEVNLYFEDYGSSGGWDY
jgi:hypothetical protein